jgi:hypothetical protein
LDGTARGGISGGSRREAFGLHLIFWEDQPMESHIRFKGGQKPPNTGFATPHVAGIAEHEPDEEVNDSLGSIHPADTMDTDPDKDPEAGGKGIGEKTAE